jgi:taurine dioxygenase
MALSNVSPLRPFGVGVELDCPGSLSADDKAGLRALLVEHGLVKMAGLHLSMAQQRELCTAFGTVHDSPYENFYISNVRSDGFLGAKELQWHNDVPYLPLPYTVAALHAVEVVPGVTSTRFVNCMDACERLPAALRQRIGSLNALQVRARAQDRRNRLEDLQPGDICTVHPVVRTQENTGRPYLFVNENMTGCIIGMSERESDALLEEIFSCLYDEAFVHEHFWKPGDLVVWDNLTVQHARGAVGDGARTLQRVTCTDFTYLQQYPGDTVGQELSNAMVVA